VTACSGSYPAQCPVAAPLPGASPVAELLGCEVGYFGGAGPGLSGAAHTSAT
jgi:hypothetical protein